MKMLRLFSLLIILVVMGCSSSGDDPSPMDDITDGSFEVSMTGDVNETKQGEAFFLHAIVTSKDDMENGSSLSISMTNETDPDEVITLLIANFNDLNGINPGTYTFDSEPDDESEYAHLSAFLTADSPYYLGTSGTVIIEKVADKQIEGSFSGILDDMNGTVINIAGEFTANGITEEI